MDDDEIGEFRILLLDRLDDLARPMAAGEAGRDVVRLDQQSVGRVSRIDAIQRQAIAQATERRKSAEILRIEHALTRMDQGEYGWCDDCGDPIGAPRLRVDPAAARCIGCAS